MNSKNVLKDLKSMGKEKNIRGMGKFGIKTENNLGVSVTDIRKYSKKIGKDHGLALDLWKTGIRDARMLAACIEDPEKVTESQIEDWVKDFDSWDICDHCCGHLIDKTSFSYKKAKEWAKREKEFEKRAGFALIAWLALHDKKVNDKEFEKFFPLIKSESIDNRNFVKKAISWALRNIGKRNLKINKKAVELAKEIKKIDAVSSKWIANDVIKELTSGKIIKRLERKAN